MKKGIIIISLIIFSVSESKSQIETGSDKPYSNPSFMMGTNFGQFFQTLYRLGNYEEMLKFTSSESIKKYGSDRILDYYSECDFGYQMKIVNKVPQGNYYILSYKATVMATTKIVRIKTIVENDTAKIVLDNLKITMK